MINPGVIALSSKRIGGLDAVIEDNLGESIHFHYGKFRFDLSLNDFYEVTDIFVSIAKDLLGELSEEIFKFDPTFLNYISENLIDLEKIEDDHVELGKMIVYGKVSKREMGWTSLQNSIMYKALKGQIEDYVHFKQDNPVFVSNLERLHSADLFVKNNCDNVGDIVLLNRGFLILDGQHRASAILSNFGDRSIKVKRFIFKTFDIKYKKHSKIFYALRRIKVAVRKLLLKVI